MFDVPPSIDVDTEPLRRVPLKEQAHRRIGQFIFRGIFPAGMALSETTVAETLGISRTPVREALAQLAADGLVDYSAFNGYRVHTISDAEREEMFVLRRTLELLAVQRLAKSATSEQLAALDGILERQNQLAVDNRHNAFLEVDAEFHLALSEFASLSLTQKFLTHIRSMFYLMGLHVISVPGRRDAVVEEHRRIVQAIRTGDTYSAEEAMISHLGTTERLLAVSSPGARP